MFKLLDKNNILIFSVLVFAFFVLIIPASLLHAACVDPDPENCPAICIDSTHTFSSWSILTCNCTGSITCACNGNYTTSCTNDNGCENNVNCSATSGYSGVYRCLGDVVQAEYLTGICSANACTSVTSWVNWENCNDDDGYYEYSTGCQDRDYYCSSGGGGTGCVPDSNNFVDYYDAYVNYCSSSTLRKNRVFHNFIYFALNRCDHITSTVDDQLVQDCGTNYCSGTIPHLRGCSGSACYDTAQTDCGTNYCSGTIPHLRGCSGSTCYDTAQADCGTNYCSGTIPHLRGCSGSTCYDTAQADCGTDYSETPYCVGTISSYYYHDRGCSGGSCYDTPILQQTQCPTPACTAWVNTSCIGGTIQQTRTCYTATCTGAGVCGSTPYTETQLGTVCQYCCSSGACTGVCSAGATGSQSCGTCATQSRTCSSTCTWGDWGVCLGVCAPTSLTASVASASQINLAWVDNSDNETGFKIERADNSDCSGTPSFSQITTVGAGVITYSNSGLTPNIFYCYRVRAYNASSDSTYSNVISTSVSSPTNLIATASATSTRQINLAWTDNSNNENSFSIERKTGSSGTYANIATVATNITTYADAGVLDGTTYYYRVRACHVMACSSYSTESFASTVLTAPTSLACSPVTSSQIDLSWVDNSDGETGFEIKRSVSTPPDTVIFTTGQNAVVYSDTNLLENTLYYYRIRAYNANSGIYSEYTNICSTSTPFYVPTGNMTSSIFDTGIANGAAFNSILWKGTQPSGSNVWFQFASSNSANPSNFIGPDGTAATYYQASGPSIAMNISTRYHNNHRYFRYKVYVYPNLSNESPQITDIIIGYSP